MLSMNSICKIQSKNGKIMYEHTVYLCEKEKIMCYHENHGELKLNPITILAHKNPNRFCYFARKVFLFYSGSHSWITGFNQKICGLRPPKLDKLRELALVLRCRTSASEGGERGVASGEPVRGYPATPNYSFAHFAYKGFCFTPNLAQVNLAQSVVKQKSHTPSAHGSN